MIGSEYGNGTMNEMARLITRDIPIHINCCDRKSLLLLNCNVCDLMSIKCYHFQIMLDLHCEDTIFDFDSTLMRGLKPNSNSLT